MRVDSPSLVFPLLQVLIFFLFSSFCKSYLSILSVTSKFVGDGEKMMRSLFEVAREIQPSGSSNPFTFDGQLVSSNIL